MDRHTQTRLLTAAGFAVAIAWPCLARAQQLDRPQQAVASIKIQDVRLDASHRLQGQLMDTGSQPLVHAPVVLWSQGTPLARSRTNRRGEFAFQVPRGGVYQVVSEKAGGSYRLWTADAAPPSATEGVLLVEGSVVRGQCQQCGGGCHPQCCQQAGLGGGHFDGALIRTLSNPWVVGGALAAGIAIPISHDDDAEGS